MHDFKVVVLREGINIGIAALRGRTFHIFIGTFGKFYLIQPILIMILIIGSYLIIGDRFFV